MQYHIGNDGNHARFLKQPSTASDTVFLLSCKRKERLRKDVMQHFMFNNFAHEIEFKTTRKGLRGKRVKNTSKEQEPFHERLDGKSCKDSLPGVQIKSIYKN